MTNNPKPTRQQVRKWFRDEGYHVRINAEGRVSLKPDPDYHPGKQHWGWQDARYVSEYFWADGNLHIR